MQPVMRLMDKFRGERPCTRAFRTPASSPACIRMRHAAASRCTATGAGNAIKGMVRPVMRKALVLGLGNVLLGDEGAGVHVIRRLAAEQSQQPDVEYLDGGTIGLTLATSIEGVTDLIIVDAAELRLPPGSVRLFEGEEMDRLLGGSRKRSVHEISLLDLMAAVRLSGRLPERRALIAIQPQRIDWADAPTGPVAQAVSVACAMAVDLIGRWRQ